MTEPSIADQGYWVSPFEELIPAPYAPVADPAPVAPAATGAEGMLASWYGPGFHGSPTASGEPFDPYGFTAAHPYLPFGTQLDVGYGGNLVRVTVNDRGPFSGDRELDLSEGAANALGLTDAGVDFVTVGYPGVGATAGAPSAPVAEAPQASAPDLIVPDGERFAPEEEFGVPFQEFTPVENQPEVQNNLLDQVDQAQSYAPDVPPNTLQEPYVPPVADLAPVAPAATGAEGMLASWYGPGFHGSPTASGEPFDPYGFTAAHPYLPFGTQLDVGYGGNLVRVTVNDRGPFSGDRELDLSEGAANALGLTDAGVDFVTVGYPGDVAAPSAPVPDPLYDPGVAYDPYDDYLDA